MTASASPPGAPAIRLRPFAPADLQAVLRLEKRVFPTQAYGRYEFLNLYRWGRETFLVAVQGERLVGYVAGLLNDAGEEGYIASIAVDPDLRRAGLGTQLMTAILDRLRGEGAARVALHVGAENDPALALYRRLGFVVERREPDYYSDGEDALVMRRAFGAQE